MRNRNFGFQISDFGLKNRTIRDPHSTMGSSRGFTYIALLAAIIIIGILLGSAGKYWQNVMLREKEEELLFRGHQYRLAIERYYNSPPGGQYPMNIDDLLVDNRTGKGKRHLRQKYKDPISGEDFAYFNDPAQGGRITGVYSRSDSQPLRQSGFSEEDKDFEGKTKYSEWKFLFVPSQPLPQQRLKRGFGGRILGVPASGGTGT